ncbi:hypothetical protein [Thalassoroseus pseudoceratinae]|uniref:hypothetical protein n=1 Tax=Thalassoroseus pseudoceratinae TaxID=2713176 RepID=UPI00141F3758|nr:hypothetical protein [Thalassoroseus pseudoceratinae]
MKRSVFAVFTSLALLIGSGSTVRAADAVAVDQKLPSNVMLFFSFPNVTEFKAQWQNTTMAKLYEDERFADFWEDVSVQVERASDELEQNVGLTLKQLASIPTGEVAMAVVAKPKQEVGIVSFLDFGDKEDAVDQLLNQAQEKLEQTDAERDVVEFEGTQIVVYSFPQIEESDTPFKPKLAYCVKDSTLMFGSTVDVLKESLVRWDGQHEDTFSGNSSYKYILSKCKYEDAKPGVKWFADPLSGLQAGLRAAAAENPQVAFASAFLPILGVNNLKGMGGASYVAAGEFEEVSKTLLHVEQPVAGLLNLFRFPETDLAPPAWIPADVDGFTITNWDAAAAYTSIETLVDNFVFRQPGGLRAKIDEIAEQEGGVGVNIKTDIIDQMDGPIYTVNYGTGEAAASAIGTPTPGMPKTVVALTLKDEKKMQGLVGKLLDNGGDAIEARDFNGETIYDLKVDPQAAGAAGANFSGVSFAVSKGLFIFSTDAKDLEQILRDKRVEPVAELPEYKKIAAHFPAKTSMLSFQRRNSQLESVYEFAKSGQLGDQIPGVDFTKLPEFSVIKDYLPMMGGYTVPDDRGALFVNFSIPTKE